MKKKLTILAVGTLCTLSLAAGALATGVIEEIKAQLRPDFTVVIDGNVKNFKNAGGDDVHPILYEGTTYLPVRAIGEIMGKTVYWYEDEKRIELKENTSTVTDADVIINESDKKPAENKKDKPTKAEKDVAKEQKKAEKDAAKADKKDIKPVEIDESQFIGEEKAKEIALEKAGLKADDVQFKKVHLDRDNGAYEYEVEFRHGLTEYDADISATDGTILSWEKDLFD